MCIPACRSYHRSGSDGPVHRSSHPRGSASDRRDMLEGTHRRSKPGRALPRVGSRVSFLKLVPDHSQSLSRARRRWPSGSPAGRGCAPTTGTPMPRWVRPKRNESHHVERTEDQDDERPRLLRRTQEIRDAENVWAQRAAVDRARVRRPPRRCHCHEGRAELVRRHRGLACRLGELRAGGDVVIPATVAANPAQPVVPPADHGVWLSATARWQRTGRLKGSATAGRCSAWRRS